jgi:phage baseplate assembly protein V
VSAADVLHRKVQMMTARGIIHATDDSGGVHKVQVRVTPAETIDAVPVVQIYGFASHAKPTSEAHLLFVTGDRSRGVAIATNDPGARPRNTAAGEVVIYTDEGDTITLARGHKINVATTGTVTIQAAGKVRVEAPRFECTGDIIDNCDKQPHTAADDRAIYNSHTHPGVQPGGGNTGAPNQKQRDG